MKNWLRSGAPWIWLTAGAVSLCLMMVLGLMLLIGYKGLTHFWPMSIYQWQVATPQGEKTLIGPLYEQEWVPISVKTAQGVEQMEVKRYVIRSLRPTAPFVSVYESDVLSKSLAPNISVIERQHQEPVFGEIITPNWRSVMTTLHRDRQMWQQRRSEGMSDTIKQSWHRALHQWQEQTLTIKQIGGVHIQIPLDAIAQVWQPNDMTTMQKIGHWWQQARRFITEDPQVANQQGGVFPAIFGTALMVILMSIVVVPFGVLAAVYLHEYAKNNALTRLIRIAVMNLAGVPSIVYGVFGLGFFVYGVGGQLDALFYDHRLPTPTFGTPGILWSALTLALLTLPVVIVSTEEGLRRVPQSVRYGSMALGATHAETLWRVVLPMITPAIMTGVILAIARAAGEVAPLMLVGAVKMAPSLPIDGQFPYLHLERQFMHLGYHLYDVTFQQANVEAAKPLVYATAGLLLFVILTLNITAIAIRHHLNKKLHVLEH